MSDFIRHIGDKALPVAAACAAEAEREEFNVRLLAERLAGEPARALPHSKGMVSMTLVWNWTVRLSPFSERAILRTPWST